MHTLLSCDAAGPGSDRVASERKLHSHARLSAELFRMLVVRGPQERPAGTETADYVACEFLENAQPETLLAWRSQKLGFYFDLVEIAKQKSPRAAYVDAAAAYVKDNPNCMADPKDTVRLGLSHLPVLNDWLRANLLQASQEEIGAALQKILPPEWQDPQFYGDHARYFAKLLLCWDNFLARILLPERAERAARLSQMLKLVAALPGMVKGTTATPQQVRRGLNAVVVLPSRVFPIPERPAAPPPAPPRPREEQIAADVQQLCSTRLEASSSR